MQREKDLERVRLLAEQYASEALQPIVNSGRADSIDVRAEQPESGGLILRIRVQTSAETFDYTASHKVPLI